MAALFLLHTTLPPKKRKSSIGRHLLVLMVTNTALERTVGVPPKGFCQKRWYEVVWIDFIDVRSPEVVWKGGMEVVWKVERRWKRRWKGGRA
jgi:hypothetical protein